MSINIVQPGLGTGGWVSASYPGSGGSGNTANITYTGTTAGNALVVINVGAGAPDATQPVYTVSDGTVYTQLEQTAITDGSNQWGMVAIHLLLNIGAGTHTIASTNSAGGFNTYGVAVACEFSGIVTSAGFDVGSNATGNSTTPASGSTGTLAQVPELAISAFSALAATTLSSSEPAGFTNILTGSAGTNTVAYSVDYQIVTGSTTALNANYGSSFSGLSRNWAAAIATIKGAIVAPLTLMGQACL